MISTCASLNYLANPTAPGADALLLDAVAHDKSVGDFVRFAFRLGGVEFAKLFVVSMYAPFGNPEPLDEMNFADPEAMAENEHESQLARLNKVLASRLEETIQTYLRHYLDCDWYLRDIKLANIRADEGGSTAWKAYADEINERCEDLRDDLNDVFYRHVSPDSGETFGDVDALIAGILKAWRKHNPVPTMARAAPA